MDGGTHVILGADIGGTKTLLEARAGARCLVGVGYPGALSPATGLVKNANSTVLNGHPLDRDLRDALQRDEVRLANDANCFAVSEATDGAGRGAAVVFGVILGTGVGGGVVIDGKRAQWPPRDRRRVGPQSDSRRGQALLLRPAWVRGNRSRRPVARALLS